MVTEIYINNTKLDLNGDLDLNLTYQINDVREVDKKSTSFSYSFIIPGNTVNNEIFGHIYEIGNDNVIFNPNKKANVQVYSDGNQIFKGFLQLIEIIKEHENEISYKVNILGPVANLFADIGEGNLNELDFSEYDHVLSRSGITKSWNTEIIKDGQYVPFQYGRGYVYPMVQYGVNTTSTSNVEEWFPAIYAKEYLDKIMDEAGYTYKSEFLNSQYFKQLVVPFSRDKIYLTDEQIAQRSAHRTRITSPFVQYADPTVVQEKTMWPTWNNTVSDPGGSFVTNQIWLCKKKGRYRFDISMLLALGFDSDGTYPFFIVGGPVTGAVRLEVAGNLVYELPFSMSFTNGPFASFVVFPQAQTFSYVLNLVRNDYVYVRIDWTYPSSNYTSKIVNSLGQGLNGVFQMRVQEGSSFKVTAYNDGIVESDPVAMNLTTPEDVSKKDYMKSLFTMFNLMVLDDPNGGEKDLIIEPRDDFYRNGGKFLDWTDKLDRRTVNLTPLYELQAKVYNFSYKEDSDFYNDKYQNNYGETYGTSKFIIDNDFLTEEKNLDVIFSPTPNAKDSSTNLSMPHFLTYDNTGAPKTKRTNIRLLFYSGLKTGSFNLYSSMELPATSALTTYPYVGMQDDPNDPDNDLAFNRPRTVYYEQTNWTDNNLFNKFHANTFNDLSNKNSKLLVGYFDLSPSDIANFSFKDKILVDGIYWRINKIEGYSPIDNKLTRVELFSLTDPFLRVPTKKPLLAGPKQSVSALTTFDYSTSPYFDPNISQPIVNGNLNNSITTSTHGSNNTIGSDADAVVVGDSNLVGDNTNSILVVGSGITIASNLSNVVVLGSSNRNISDSNVVIIDNSFVFKSGSGPIPFVDLVDGGYNTVQNAFNSLVPIDIIDVGLNSSRPYGSDSIVHIVDSGLDDGIGDSVPIV